MAFGRRVPDAEERKIASKQQAAKPKVTGVKQN